MSSVGLLQPLAIPVRIWEDIAMNFIIRLSNSFGFTVIMVVVNRLSKYGYFVALKTNYNSRMVVEMFIQNIVKLHGILKSIVSDRDKIFTSQFSQHLFKLQGTSLAMSSNFLSTIRWPIRGTKKQMSRNVFKMLHILESKELVQITNLGIILV